MTLRKIILAICLIASIGAFSQNSDKAMSVLDSTAKVVGKKSGASADFTFSNSKLGTVSGSIAIKGNKFNAQTPQTIVWFNGKTQWAYMKNNQEVNISTPTQAQQQMMNPYTFINIYKTGYTMSLNESGQNYEAHLTAQNKKRTIQELYITINKKTHIPSKIKMRQHSTWSTITVSNFKHKNLSDRTFTFNSKDFPKAEIIDLR